MNHRPLQLAVSTILQNAIAYEWSVQGFGILRLYLGRLGRLHVWDSRLTYPKVSVVHNHSWDLRSTVVWGELTNIRYYQPPPPIPDVDLDEGGATPHGEMWPPVVFGPYYRARLLTGFNSRMVSEPKTVFLTPHTPEKYGPGDVYVQKGEEIHETRFEDGTVTLMERNLDDHGEADVFWRYGDEWGTATPRKATTGEILTTTRCALERFS